MGNLLVAPSALINSLTHPYNPPHDAGDIVAHDGKIWKAKVDIAFGTDFDEDDFDSIIITDEIVGNQEDIATINETIGDVPSGKTVQGQIDTLNSNFSKYVNDGRTIIIKVKQVTIPTSELGGNTFSPTSRSIGTISAKLGINVTQTHIMSIAFYQTGLTPAANLAVGLYSDNIYISASQNTTIDSGGLSMIVTYWEYA